MFVHLRTSARLMASKLCFTPIYPGFWSPKKGTSARTEASKPVLCQATSHQKTGKIQKLLKKLHPGKTNHIMELAQAYLKSFAVLNSHSHHRQTPSHARSVVSSGVMSSWGRIGHRSKPICIYIYVCVHIYICIYTYIYIYTYT